MFSIGQRVGIVSGLQAAGGPVVTRYGTVVDVVEFWRGVLEYVVRHDSGGEDLVYRGYLLRAVDVADEPTDNDDEVANQVAQREAELDQVALTHVAGLTMDVETGEIGGTVISRTYQPANVVAQGATVSDAARWARVVDARTLPGGGGPHVLPVRDVWSGDREVDRIAAQDAQAHVWQSVTRPRLMY